MSMPSHRLPPPVSQTVGGSAAAEQLGDVPATDEAPVDPRLRVQQQQRQNEPAGSSRPGRQQDSVSTSTKPADSKRPSVVGPDLPRSMRPQSVMKSYMKYLTSFEQHEIFDYQQVELYVSVVYHCLVQ